VGGGKCSTSNVTSVFLLSSTLVVIVPIALGARSPDGPGIMVDGALGTEVDALEGVVP